MIYGTTDQKHQSNTIGRDDYDVQTDLAPLISMYLLFCADEPLVDENSPPEQFVALVTTTVEDSDADGAVVCTTDTDVFQLRRLMTDSYALETTVMLDREHQASYDVSITCTDQSTPARRSVYPIAVEVADKNDNIPMFPMASYYVEVIENAEPGNDILITVAIDQDTGENAELTYSVTGEMSIGFVIDANSGTISTRYSLDHEQMSNIQFIVVAVDHGNPPRSGTTTVEVEVIDVNDNAPEFESSDYLFTAVPDHPPFAPVGYISALDADSAPFDEMIFSIQDNDVLNLFDIRTSTNVRTVELFTLRHLDTTSVHHLTVVATDAHNPDFSSTAHVVVMVF